MVLRFITAEGHSGHEDRVDVKKLEAYLIDEFRAEPKVAKMKPEGVIEELRKRYDKRRLA